ncbi:MAG: hypothetical protein H7144_09825 [Burkholderiales bacterium]|nr:hypothetical protein [Phycisphaerae bacterium]
MKVVLQLTPWIASALCLALIIPAHAQQPAALPGTPPASQPSYVPGLVCEVYALPRRPRRIREMLPGLPPKDVHVAPTPIIDAADDLAGHTGNVQAEFAGEINIPTAGEYAFTASADDGMESQIDGQVVITDLYVNGSKPQSIKTVTLKEGWQPVRVRFFQGDGGFRLDLRWRPPGASDWAAIPAENFRVSDARVEVAKRKLSAEPSDDPALAHRSVFRTQGFFELPESEGDLLVELLEGPTNYSTAARKDFADTIKQTNYEKLPYWHQVKVLSGYLRGWYSGSTDRGTVTMRAEYTLSDAEATEYRGWAGAKRQGFRHIATIEGKQYTIYTPAADSPERENVAKGVAGLPQTLRIMLETVTVEPYGTANEFNGGGNNIWVRRKEATPFEMIDNTFSHEIGHLLMNKTDCYLPWEKAISADLLSPSHYARMNPSEDFAEYVRMFLATEGDSVKIASLVRLFPARSVELRKSLEKVHFQWPGRH